MSATSTILAIETSCDETGLAVLQKAENNIEVLADAIASQIDIHKETGGVVPEVAAREHVAVMRPLLQKVLREAGIDPVRGRSPQGGRSRSRQSERAASNGVDAIAVTVGPGLQPALAVGVSAARTLSYAWQKPLLPVHHIEGHIYSALFAKSAEEIKNDLHPTTYTLQSNLFPALALIVSGGHTLLIRVADHLQYEVVGTTRDDAAGEAFDKVGRMLDLPYPGGPAISQLAKDGNPSTFDFPRPMLNSDDLDFSFAGLKTAVFYLIRDMTPQEREKQKANIAASFQQAVVDSLVGKTEAALIQSKPKTVLLAGGVAANQQLRSELITMVSAHNTPLRIAPLSLCGDNAVMIGQAGLFAFEKNRVETWDILDAEARPGLELFNVSFSGPSRARSG